MALTYIQIDALVSNATFLGRLRSAVASHAEYWRNNVNATAAQKSWCFRVFDQVQCAQIAANMARELCQDVAITGSTTGDGSDVLDAALQTAVDKICEHY